MQPLFFNHLLAIIRAELMFNSRRVVFYALMIFFVVNAVVWWQGASIYYGWATNSDFYIARMCGGFTFMTTPFFVAMVMGDAVTRDFRFEVAPLLLSQPIRRGEYVLGKFIGNFLSLLLCCFAFPLTLLCLQAARPEGMIVFPPRFVPYAKFFFVLVVIPHFALAAGCFLLGMLSRNPRMVYVLIVALYGLYLPFMMFLEFRAPGWSRLLDPLLFDWVNALSRNQPAELINHLVIQFDTRMIANRLMLLGLGGLFLLLACRWFKGAEPAGGRVAAQGTLGLVERPERLYQETAPSPLLISSGAAITATIDSTTGPANYYDRQFSSDSRDLQPAPRGISQARLEQSGRRAWSRRLAAALRTEFKLLRMERSLIALMPFTLLLSIAQVGPLRTASDLPATLSAGYAANVADALMLLLFAIAVFYTGEATARDEEVKIGAILRSLPVNKSVFLLSKFAALWLLSLSITILAMVTALSLQVYRTSAVPSIYPYVAVCAIILLPGVASMLAFSLLLHVLLRDKYLAYGVNLAVGGSLYYLLTQGYHHWLYNPLLLNLWSAADLYPAAPAFTKILLYRLYWLCVTLGSLMLAHRYFRRPSA